MSAKNATEQVKNYIYNDLLRGATQSNLVDKLTKDLYEVGIKYSAHTSRDLISKVRRMVRADYLEERKELRETNLNRLLDLYSEAKDNKDRFTALKTLQELNKMCGLYEAEKVDVNINGNITVDFGFDNED